MSWAPCDLCGGEMLHPQKPRLFGRSSVSAPTLDVHHVCTACAKAERGTKLFVLAWVVLSFVVLGYALIAHPPLPPERVWPVLGVVVAWFGAGIGVPLGVWQWRASLRRAVPVLERTTYEELLSGIRSVRDTLDAWTSGDAELRAMRREAWLIGAELHRRGGKTLMLQAFRDAKATRSIEISWDGVGEWRG